VAVEATVVLVFWTLERTPTAGSPPAVFAESQAAEAEGLGVGVAVVGFGVVVKEQSKVADTSVAPVTVATIVCDCVGTITENDPETVTSTWLAALLLPHPLTHRLENAAASRMFLALFCHFITTVSPAFARFASVSPLLRC
jgi:hypothetical protein